MSYYQRKTNAQLQQLTARHKPGRTQRRDTIEHFNQHNSPLTSAELQRVQTTLDDCMTALRRVRYEQVHVQALHTFWQIAQEIERSRIVKGFAAQISAAKQASTAIYNRCAQPTGWHATPLHGSELTALDDMAFYYMYQVKQLSYGEMWRLQNRVIHRARSTGEEVAHVRVETLHIAMTD